MRKHHSVRVSTAALVVAVLALAIPASPSLAQSATLSASIPFDFHVADRLLPAGTYTFLPIGNGSGIQIANERQVVASVICSPAWNANIRTSRLIFNRYGDMTFLSELHWQDYGNGRALPASALEKEVRKGQEAIPLALQIGR